MLRISSVWRIRQMDFHTKVFGHASMTHTLHENPLGSERLLKYTYFLPPPPHIFTANIHLKTGGSMRRKLPLVFCFFAFFFYLLVFPLPALESARHGLLLWYHSVVPVLFPFMLLGNFALRTGLIYPLTALFYRPLHLLFGCSQAGCFAVHGRFSLRISGRC